MKVPLLTELSRAQLPFADTDGPWLMPDGVFALKVSLRGSDGGFMPSPSELRWRRELPERMSASPFRVFLRRQESVVFLGMASAVRPRRYRLAEPLPEAAWRELVAAATAPLPPSPVERLAALRDASTTDACTRALASFVESWFGPAAAASPPAREDLPMPLARAYEITAGRRVFIQNRLTEPSPLELARDGDRSHDADDDKLIFYVENQGCCSWAIDRVIGEGHAQTSSADPPVYASLDDGQRAWRRECERLSVFLLQVIILEATFNASFTASSEAVSPRTYAKLTRHVAPFAWPAWEASGTRFFAGEGLLGFANEVDGSMHLALAAREREAFEAIEELIADWPHIGF